MNLDGPVPDVVTKRELDDGFTRVTLSESEDDDGTFNILNIEGMFGLGPVLEVDGRYNRGFSRKVIGDVHARFVRF
jgi:hypothetical protein